MLQNIWNTAVRALLRNKVYTLINFSGLTLGLTLALLIITYVRFELSYDNFSPNADRLYRITNTTSFGRSYALTPPALAMYLKDYFAGIEEVARVYERSVSIRLSENQQAFEEEKIYFADSTLLNLMPLQFVAGDEKRVLSEKFTIVINEEMALKYFGKVNPIGEALVLGGKHSFRITGVVRDFPPKSHFHFNMLVPYENMYDLETDANAASMRANLATNFVTTHSYTYVLLKQRASPAEIDDNMPAFIRAYAPPERQVGQRFTLMKVTDIHLHSTLVGEAEAPNSIATLLIFIAVGLLTIAMACINYINLTTAQSLTRVKEIGMRKILGADKKHLVIKFFAESFVFCAVAFLVAYVCVFISLPQLNTLTNRSLTFQDVIDPTVLAFSAGLLLFVTALAGAYPAYFVFQYKTVNALRESTRGFSHMWLRKALVTLQMSVALALLVASIVIVNQIDFMVSRPLGFEKEQVIAIPLFSDNMNAMYGKIDSDFYNRLQVFRNKIELQPDIVSTSLSSDVPGVGGIVYRSVVPEGFAEEDRMTLPGIATDYDFLKTYDIELVAGRAFDQTFATDATSAYIINESAVTEFGWHSADAAIGKTIFREYDGKPGQVIGVVRDFHFDVLTTPITGLLLDINLDQAAVMSMRFSGNDLGSFVKKIATEWSALFPEKSFQYEFVDQQLAREYRSYRQLGTTIHLFTLIAITICTLGVYGLVLFAVQRKVKEIGVRKVLGASTISIMQMIHRDFTLLVLLAIVFAAPFTYWFMHHWLDQFAYRIGLGGLPFLLSTILLLTVVLITISFQVARASMANPVKALRSD